MIVLLSGGMDSTVALFWALREHADVETLAIDYGQRHRVELGRARRIAALAGVPHREVCASIPWAPSALTGAGSFDADRVIVPGRNLILLTLAASGGSVVIGCSGADAERFPDCRVPFLDAAAEALSLGLGRRIEVLAPLVHRSKAQTVELMRELGDDCARAVGLSWSCYDPQDAGARSPIACGRCLACEARARGFGEVGMRDPGAV